MRIYLGADYARKEEMHKKAAELRSHGHSVTSRWHDMGSPYASANGFGTGGVVVDSNNIKAAADCALANIEDICSCDVFIVFTTGEKSRGGRHWETGYATGQGKKIAIVGVREHAFQCLSSVEHYDTWEQFLVWNTNEG